MPDSALLPPPESTERILDSGEVKSKRSIHSAGKADRNAIVPAPQTALVTTRVGVTFVVIAVASFACAFAALHVQQYNFSAMMWLATTAICSLAGVITMRSVRTLRTIEVELQRVTGHPKRWKSVRPIVGSDHITEGWNELLDLVNETQAAASPKRAPAGLDQEAVTLARAMRGLPIPWVITDQKGAVRFIGPAACGLFGLPDDANHTGRDLLELIGLDDPKEEESQKMRDRLLSNVRMVNERVTLKLGQREGHLRITRSRLIGRSGDGQGLAWVLSDVTQQRIATEARDQFLMTATHELRTPLNNLQAYAEALHEEDDLEVERQKEFCNVIVSESRRLGRLVDQLLTVGQLDAGSMIINRHELEIRPLVEYATDQMQAQSEQKSQTLIADLAAKLPTVIGDRDKLQAALVNLVANAVKYTPEDGEIFVRGDVEGDFIRIQIQDNGPGIPKAEQSKVFERFYRGTATETTEKGNGLGLAFTREVARMHGGDVELESEPGAGCTFTMRLPVGGQSRSAI